MISNAQHYKEQLKALLKAENLPVSDLPESFDNFLVAIIDNEIAGAAGLEIYGEYGLLRSVAVGRKHRNLGIAAKLIDEITTICISKEISTLYLLTETAAEYFKNKGFIQIGREQVPAEIKASSEFSQVCPVSAIVMKKSIA